MANRYFRWIQTPKILRYILKKSLFYISDNSNQPDQVLETISSIVRLEYHPKDVNYLAAGLYNGQVAFFDLRTHNEPVELTSYDESHRDPVYNLLWSTSKTGLEFFTATTDGFCKW